MNNNAVIYARFSSDKQDAQTIEVQLKKGNNYAKDNQLNVIKEYKDEAKTGRNGNRYGLQSVLKDYDNGLMFQYFIVYNTDRFFREAADGMQFIKELEKRNIKYLSTTEYFSDNAAGRLSLNMNLVIAQYYSDLYSEKITNGLENNASKCLSIGSGIPLGFKTIDRVFVIDDEKAIVVKKIFEMYDKDYIMADIIRYLNNQGLKTKKGNDFDKNSIRRILRNKKYTGTYIYKGKETPNAIPRIIEDDLFYRVQDKMQKNKEAPARARAKEHYLLTTKVFCGECKSSMIGKGGTSKTGKLHTYYGCNKTNNIECDKKNIQKQLLEDLVIKATREMLTNDYINEVSEMAVKTCEEQQDTHNLERLKKLFKDNNKKVTNLINAVADCEVTSVRKTYELKINELETQQTELNKEIIREERNFIKIKPKDIIFFFKQLRKGNENDIKYRKALVNAFVNSVYVYKTKVIIAFNISNKQVELDLDKVEDMERVLIKEHQVHQIEKK